MIFQISTWKLELKISISINSIKYDEVDEIDEILFGKLEINTESSINGWWVFGNTCDSPQDIMNHIMVVWNACFVWQMWVNHFEGRYAHRVKLLQTLRNSDKCPGTNIPYLKWPLTLGFEYFLFAEIYSSIARFCPFLLISFQFLPFNRNSRYSITCQSQWMFIYEWHVIFNIAPPPIPETQILDGA